MFKSKKIEKNLRFSKANINNIENLLNDIMEESGKQVYLRTRIASLKNILCDNNPSDQDKALELDYYIINALEAIRGDIRTGNHLSALERLDNLSNSEQIRQRCGTYNPSSAMPLPKNIMREQRARERMIQSANIAATDDPLTVLYTTLYDEYNRALRAVDTIHKEFLKTSAKDVALKEYLRNKENRLRIKLNSSKEILDLYTNEQMRDMLVNVAKRFISTQNTLITRKFGISDADYDLLLKDYVDAKQKMAERYGQVAQANNIINTPVESFVASDTYSNAGNVQMPSSNAGFVPINTGAGSERTFQDLKNGGKDIDYESKRDELKDAIRELNRMYNFIDNKQDMENDEMKDIDEQIKKLIIKRRNAPKSEHLMLDSEIDSLESRRHTCERNIKGYVNKKAQINEEIRLAKEALSKLEVRAREAESEHNLTAEDYSDIAMGIKSMVEEENEALGDLKIASSIADSADIDLNTFTSSEYDRDKSEEEEDDDDKYLELEKRYGIK